MAKSGVITETDEDKDAKQVVSGAEEVELPEAKVEKDDGPEVVEGKTDSNLDVGGQIDETEEQHKETSRERRERARKAKERDRAELRFQKSLIDNLQQQLAQVTRHTADTRIAQIQDQLTAAQNDAKRYQEIRVAAMKANNAEDTVAAENYQREAEARAAQLDAEKNRLQTAVKAAPQQQQQQRVPWQSQAEDFLKDKPWYDAKGRDEDSLIVLAIDKALIANNFDPRTEEYWEELEERTRKRLPHRFKAQKNDDEPGDDDDAEPVKNTRKGPPVGGGRSGQGKAGTITLSPERVAMLKEAGLWDDQKTRQRMAIKYREYDKNNATASR